MRKRRTAKSSRIPESVEVTAEQIADKELAFAREYAHSWNKTQAAILAGYSEEEAARIGYALMQKIHIQKAVHAIQQERADSLEIDSKWAMDQFKDTYIASRDKGDESTANKALVEMCKMMGFYEKHNKQKVPTTQAEIDALKERLRSRGVDLDKVTHRSAN